MFIGLYVLIISMAVMFTTIAVCEVSFTKTEKEDKKVVDPMIKEAMETVEEIKTIIEEQTEQVQRTIEEINKIEERIIRKERRVQKDSIHRRKNNNKYIYYK